MNTIDVPRKSRIPTVYWLLILGVASGVVVLAASFGTWKPAGGVVPDQDGSPIVTVNFPVEGMTCATCVAAIKGTVEKIDGVTAVEVDLAERRARISYHDGKISPDEIAASIRKLGYQPGTPVAESGK